MKETLAALSRSGHSRGRDRLCVWGGMFSKGNHMIYLREQRSQGVVREWGTESAGI